MQVEERKPTPATAVPPHAHAPLTPREHQIAMAITEGRTNREIALKLGITEQTVKNHLTSIFVKLGVENRLQLALTLVRRS